MNYNPKHMVSTYISIAGPAIGVNNRENHLQKMPDIPSTAKVGREKKNFRLSRPTSEKNSGCRSRSMRKAARKMSRSFRESGHHDVQSVRCVRSAFPRSSLSVHAEKPPSARAHVDCPRLPARHSIPSDLPDES